SPARRPTGRARAAGPATTAAHSPASPARPSAIQRRRPALPSYASPSGRPPASTEQGPTNRFGGRAEILTGPGADRDQLYNAKLPVGKGIPVPGCPPHLGRRSRRPAPESGHRAPDPTMPMSIDPVLLRAIRPTQVAERRGSAACGASPLQPNVRLLTPERTSPRHVGPSEQRRRETAVGQPGRWHPARGTTDRGPYSRERSVPRL